MTFGLADKFAAAMDAATQPLLGRGSSAENFGQRYSENVGGEQKQTEEFEQAHPYVSTAAELGGGALSLSPIAETSIGGRLLGLTDGSLPLRAAMSAGTGATIGATNAALGGGDITHGAETGAFGGALGPIAGQAVGKVVEGARGLVSKLPSLLSADEIAQASNALYKSPEIANVTFKPDAIDQLQDSMRKNLGKINNRLAPTTHGLIDTLDDPINGKDFTIEDLETTRQMLGRQAGNFANPQEQTAAIGAKQTIDNYLKNVPQGDLLSGDADAANAALVNARRNWAAQKTSDVLSGKVDAAELSAAAANSGANYENALRQRLKGILLSPAQKAKFAQFPGVLEEMENIVRGGSAANLLRIAGNVMGGGGGLGAVASSAGAAMAGAGPAAFAVPAAGAAIKAASNRLMANRVAALDEMIRSAAPANAGAVATRNTAAQAAQARIARMRKVGALLGQAATPALSPPVGVSYP